MVKMEVVFKNGIAVSDLVRLHNMIKKYGGEGVFVPLKNVEAQNTSDNTQSRAERLTTAALRSQGQCPKRPLRKAANVAGNKTGFYWKGGWHVE
jgi:hypothetical protein